MCAANPSNEVHLLSLYKSEAADFQKAINQSEDKLLTVQVVKEQRLVKSVPFNISNDEKCLLNADIVIISLPAFAHAQYLNAAKRNIRPTKDKSSVFICIQYL